MRLTPWAASIAIYALAYGRLTPWRPLMKWADKMQNVQMALFVEGRAIRWADLLPWAPAVPVPDTATDERATS